MNFFKFNYTCYFELYFHALTLQPTPPARAPISRSGWPFPTTVESSNQLELQLKNEISWVHAQL